MSSNISVSYVIYNVLQVKCHACVGGTSVRQDTLILQEGVHVVVGTPGRVFDMLRRRALRSESIRMFMLDEADEMLSRGFKDQIYDIFQLLPPKLQVDFTFSPFFSCSFSHLHSTCNEILITFSVSTCGIQVAGKTLTMFSPLSFSCALLPV